MSSDNTIAPAELTRSAPRSILGTGVIVTGGASGLGRATALLLAGAGRPVAVWDIDEQGARQVAEACRARGVQALGVGVDVGDRSAVEQAAATSRQALGEIGGLVCCAGVFRLGPVGQIDFAEWDLILRVNLNGVAHTVESVLPSLREVGRGAAIVVVASTEALHGSPLHAAYTASKHGILGLVRSAALRLGREGIRINAICPGAMDTPMLADGLRQAGDEFRNQLIASIPLGYISDPAEVGRVICFFLSPEASYVTGAAVPVDGGMLA
ncbi:SDR family NAD(P)-dependent oxidoreductase [Sorangium sp. So ce291]|uniref:SDR family NAD(P)-dependent oxidoreductase n=1 Tax=Sorangium sp. So ce291 TaxID=3133294 RepID=UPI003F60683B